MAVRLAELTVVVVGNQREQRLARLRTPAELEQNFTEHQPRFARCGVGADGTQRALGFMQIAATTLGFGLETRPAQSIGAGKLRALSHELDGRRVATRADQRLCLIEP